MHPKNDFVSILHSYKRSIEQKIQEEIAHLGEKTPLRDGCEYALLNGGKRLRPVLTMMVADALGNGLDVSYSAMSIEFSHTASLVADDLPCMDDDDERRNKPSLHKVFGESLALLVSYALISASYSFLTKNLETLRKKGVAQEKCDRICVLGLENASFNTGVFGATGGQFLDISIKEQSLEALLEIIQKKTASFFEVAFVLGWLYGGGGEEQLEMVKKASSHFGMAFQIADDIQDCEQDKKKENPVNLALLLGEKEAEKLFKQELNGFRQTLKRLKIDSEEFLSLAAYLENSIRS